VQNENEDERLTELLMQRVTGAMSAPEADALAQAVPKLPRGEVARWERAAAELTAALAESAPAVGDQMPSSLFDRVVATGEASVRSQPKVLPLMPAGAPLSAPRTRRMSLGMLSGWAAAAAVLIISLLSSRRSPSGVDVPQAPVVLTAAQLRDSLLVRDSAASPLAWTATADSSAAGASGDVVWSNRAQRGVMRFAGLKPNDRARWQYQLWIFDKSRNEKYPVDGGVFDVPAGEAEVYVKIDPRVPVGEAVLFAVTVEQAGGVVVSTRERIAVLAKVGG
jgi:anti-sigma-K factor RskA